MKARVPKEYNSRLVPVEVAGTLYYLNFSTKAANLFAQKFGGVEKVREVANSADVDEQQDEVIAEEFDLATLVEIITILIQQGAAYIRYVHREDDTPTISEEELEAVTNIQDIVALMDKVTEAIDKGSKQEIVAEAKNQKNGKTGRSK